MPIPNEVWKCFNDWYGGGPEFERSIFAGADGKPRVELYQPVLYGMIAGENGAPSESILTYVVSKKCTMEKLFGMMKASFSKETAECRMWYRYMVNSSWTLVANMESTVEELGLASGDKLILEAKNFCNNHGRVITGRWMAAGEDREGRAAVGS